MVRTFFDFLSSNLRDAPQMQYERKNPLTGDLASASLAMQASDMGMIAARADAAWRIWSGQGPNAR
ncbi:MAG TPA: hypothetical protein VGE05_11575, partial [Novosphingobium sp.]